jgi:hypothetical protein
VIILEGISLVFLVDLKKKKFKTKGNVRASSFDVVVVLVWLLRLRTTYGHVHMQAQHTPAGGQANSRWPHLASVVAWASL